MLNIGTFIWKPHRSSEALNTPNPLVDIVEFPLKLFLWDLPWSVPLLLFRPVPESKTSPMEQHHLLCEKSGGRLLLLVSINFGYIFDQTLTIFLFFWKINCGSVFLLLPPLSLLKLLNILPVILNLLETVASYNIIALAKIVIEKCGFGNCYFSAAYFESILWSMIENMSFDIILVVR